MRIAKYFVACNLVWSVLAADPITESKPAYGEAWRPQFHFSPLRNWMNDPNGLVYYEGEYHLFYQYNPFGDRSGHLSWGHAVSEDLVHWKELRVAIPERDGVMAFSGSIVVDWKNTSGFGSGETPPMVAVFTGHEESPEFRQTQHVAYSNDRGRTWTPYSGNPVIDLKLRDFRDPKVFWYEEGEYWVMTVAMPTEHEVVFFRSKDLKKWVRTGKFGPFGATGGLWECPDLFEMPVEGRPGESKWVLIINVGNGSANGGSGGQYFIGHFDGDRFESDTVDGAVPTRWLDYGRDFYATVTWSDVPASDGRRLAIGWMSNWNYAQETPTTPWRGAQSLVRELSLVQDHDDLRLVQRPNRELKKLRAAPEEVRDLTVSDGTFDLAGHGVRGNVVELSVMLELVDANDAGLIVASGDDYETRIGYDRVRQVLYVDRTNSGQFFHDDFAGRHEAPLVVEDGALDLRVFVDASLLEVFAEGGRVTFADQIFPPPDHDRIKVFANGGAARIVDLQAYPLRSIWTGETIAVPANAALAP